MAIDLINFTHFGKKRPPSGDRMTPVAVNSGVLVLSPYQVSMLPNPPAKFTVSAGHRVNQDAMACTLVVEVPFGTTAPDITWGSEGGSQEFNARTDAEDLTCDVGTNVFWITEYAPNKFVVARWHKGV